MNKLGWIKSFCIMVNSLGVGSDILTWMKSSSSSSVTPNPVPPGSLAKNNISFNCSLARPVNLNQGNRKSCQCIFQVLVFLCYVYLLNSGRQKLQRSMDVLYNIVKAWLKKKKKLIMMKAHNDVRRWTFDDRHVYQTLSFLSLHKRWHFCIEICSGKSVSAQQHTHCLALQHFSFCGLLSKEFLEKCAVSANQIQWSLVLINFVLLIRYSPVPVPDIC